MHFTQARVHLFWGSIRAFGSTGGEHHELEEKRSGEGLASAGMISNHGKALRPDGGGGDGHKRLRGMRIELMTLGL